MKVVAFVPAKGSSERIPSKNLRVLDGEHLFKRKLRQLLECETIDEIYLDTESDEIIALAKDLDVKVIRRDPSLSTNATDGHEMFANECRQVPDADIYVQCLCTAPFVDADTIDRAIQALLNSDCDSLVAVSRTKQYQWADGEPLYGHGRIPNSVDLPDSVVEAMSLYAVKRTGDGSPSKRFGRNPLLFELDAREMLDINYPKDLALAEHICLGAREEELRKFRLMKTHLSSAVLSDITKDLGLDCTLVPEIRAMTGTRILGRAKTLHLGALDEKQNSEREEWKGIYKALNSYKFIRPGDVIVVATDVPQRAYFGELNAHLALRAGAVGVLVDGFTRDIEGVRPLELPVFARGSYCNDIKYEGTLLGMNEKISVGGVSASNDDVVFADADGAVIVPGNQWDKVLDIAVKAIMNEAQISLGVSLGQPVEDLIDTHGYF
ncbi:NTP transferase domain-containing protein [Parvularcula sp. ZS-1/3]|uniref:NTP transferase domain-containing protein n=1 Tax=Parvularcula mediterranea TaxID=2732508 RepID=A0A7Y3RMI6_9PROT|nr:NTP transferase domain-containing protein [Parvularcula mediterranea]NNU16759.1 NTP transferase domain-containing protein [Parvularcula mediterranea]